MEELYSENKDYYMPLAYKMRPKSLNEFIGQATLVGEGKVLNRLIKSKKMVNAIFFGPPGTGKTTLAEIISREVGCTFISANATNLSVTEVKEYVKLAKERLKLNGQKTILFLDEIHRFNKLQQDSLLPSTEDGTIVLIGATTENPYFSINNSLLSRSLIFEFKKLENKDIKELIFRASQENNKEIYKDVIDYIVDISGGDARRALNYFELINNMDINIEINELKDFLGKSKVHYDKEQDHYDIISAFIKSIRGSDPDSAIYWLGKMLLGGEPPEFIARRLVILAAEDVGLANPDALNIAVSAMTAVLNIGMPEARIILAEAVIYLAISSKSNSAYDAIGRAYKDIENGKLLEVPNYLKSSGIDREKYKYPHSYSGNFVYQEYTPEKLVYYIPGDNKNETLIREKMKKLWGDKYG